MLVKDAHKTLEIGPTRRAFSSSVARKAAPDVTLTVDGKEVTVPTGEPERITILSKF